MILVTGATGHIGSELVRLLSRKDLSVRAVTRDPRRGPSLPGVQWVKGELRDARSLPGLFRGADRMFLLTSNSEVMATLQVNAIAAARAAGVGLVVKGSALGASDHSKSPIGRAHHEVESVLQESGMTWTILRPHVFMQNFLDMAPTIAREGEIRGASGDGRIPFIDARDIAAVAAVTLTSPGHESKKFVVTGPEALSYGESPRFLEIQSAGAWTTWPSRPRRPGSGSFGPGPRLGASRVCSPWPPISAREAPRLRFREP